MSRMGLEPNLLSSTPSFRADPNACASPRFLLGLPEIVTLCIYGGLLAWAIPHHEPWADEAQAWQIARVLPLGHIFRLKDIPGSGMSVCGSSPDYT
jgi:hypothetical protein